MSETRELRNRPVLTNAGLPATSAARVIDEFGDTRDINVAAERPLTIYLDRREIVTLMTLGTHPELLVLGYLRNQRLVDSIEEIASVQVDWEVAAAAVTTTDRAGGNFDRLNKRTVTSGCGQGTMFGDLREELAAIRLPEQSIRQSLLYSLLRNINEYNDIYKQAGAVHGCALCRGDRIIMFVEDVGRHNAVDAIAGAMWLDGIDNRGCIFYTTGRLTSEMVIKVAQIGVPVLVSRSGITQMGLDIARDVGVTLIARAKGRHFLVASGAERVELDDMPRRPPDPPGGAPKRTR